MFYLLQTGFIQKLEQLDQWLFVKINSGLANPFFDNLMPFMRNGMNWAPLYLFLAVFVLVNFKGKGAWWILLFVATVALTDMGGNLLKNNIGRLRPCNDPSFFDHVRLLLNSCGTGKSFVSNHAANHFGMAAFFYITFRDVFGKWAWIAFLWAGLIAFAQVYVGIHYPTDVLAGASVGLIAGTITGKVFNKRYRFAIFDNQHQPEA